MTTDNEFLFHEYMEYKGLNINTLTGKQFSRVVKDYEIDRCDTNFPLYNKNKVSRLLLKKYIPKQLLYLYRYLREQLFFTKSACLYYIKKNKYRYGTIYIVGGNRCAGIWLREILVMILDGYTRYHPHVSGPNGGNFDINSTIANNIKNKLYVIISHTPPKPSNISFLNKTLSKYIVTIRDPRDVIVSIYYHMHKYPCGPTSFWDYGLERDLPWPTLSREILSYDKKEFIDVLIDRILLSVLNFMVGWIDIALSNSNVLLVKYEDLKTNTLNEVHRILDFYKITIDDAKIIEAISALNPKNSSKIHINYSTGRVPADDKYYLLPHNDWDKHLTIDQQHTIEEMSTPFYHKAGYVGWMNGKRN